MSSITTKRAFEITNKKKSVLKKNVAVSFILLNLAWLDKAFYTNIFYTFYTN